MSGASYDEYKESISRRSKEMDECDYSSYTTRSKMHKEKVTEKSHEPRKERDKSDLYDNNLVKLKITKPKKDVNRLHIILIDNSGSNSIIAKHIRDSSGYFMSVLNTIDPQSQVAFMYCSDHSDGENFIQSVDYLFPDKEGDKALYSTLQHVRGANGHDAAEAFECALWQACEINFGNASQKHLYLATDVVGHGMGMSSDDGCPYQRYWKDSKNKVYDTFTSFEVIGCGGDAEVGKLQTQFLKDDRIQYDLIDLSSIKESYHRAAITINAVLFLIARKTGRQGIELFLSFLYEKWLEDPIFGSQTEERAKDMIKRFGKFIELPENEIDEIMKKILV